ncbi:MAG: ABC transporter substrate-binding protein [Candidatus Tectomicrobia bacterium]
MSTSSRHPMVWIALSSLLLVGALVVSEAGEPQEIIRRTITDVLAILADEQLKAPERCEERREKMRQVVFRYFGFEEMARRALGRHWRKLTPTQQQKFVPLFGTLLERSYISKIEGYGGKAQNIRYLKEKISQGRAQVRTEIPRQRDLDVEVEYRLLQRQHNWTVYDIVIEGVSLVSNYRTQFNKIIRQDSYVALEKKLKLKLEQQESTRCPKQGS